MNWMKTMGDANAKQLTAIVAPFLVEIMKKKEKSRQGVGLRV